MASYTMYLVHYFTLDIFERYLPLHPTVGIMLAFAASGIFSEGIRRIVEVPFRRFGRLGHLSSPH
jgi:peptidoglycan/LPS O-acetylase OafA/YrhL